MKMFAVGKGLKLLLFCAAEVYCQQGLTKAEVIAPALKSMRVELVETGEVVPAEHHSVFHLKDEWRDRHVEIAVDRSVCKGKLMLNGAVIEEGNITTMVRFDRGNRVSVDGCLERTPSPVEVIMMPKVHIAKAKARATTTGWDLEVTVRNTLQNSASCSLTGGGSGQDFLLGPETSQTRNLSVRLDNREYKSILLELHKFEESMEGAYRHEFVVELPRKAP